MTRMRLYGLTLTTSVALLCGTACGNDTDVCAAQTRAVDACGFVPAPVVGCEDNVAKCGDGERDKWVSHFDCMASHCDAGEPQLVVEEACADHTKGVSWDCSPGGSGI